MYTSCKQLVREPRPQARRLGTPGPGDEATSVLVSKYNTVKPLGIQTYTNVTMNMSNY